MTSFRIADRLLDRLGLALLAATFALVAAFAVARPLYNWDMLAYVALAGETQAMDAAARHDRAYQRVHAAVPAADWDLLTGSSDYRRTMFADPSAFDGQLGMYRIKPAYVFLARLVARWTSAVDAVRLLNFAALALLFAATAWWMARGAFGRMALPVVPVFVLGGLPEAARIITPDLLCAALAVTGLALLRSERRLAAAACFAVATATRPDFVVFPVALVATSLAVRTSRIDAATCAVASLAAYGLTMLAGQNPGWWPHFSASLIGHLDDLDAAPAFTLAAYLGAIARALAANVTTQQWPWLAALLGALWLLLRDRPAHPLRQPDVLFGALLLSLAARCATFPVPADRLYMATIMMLAMLVAERWGARETVEPMAKPREGPSQ